MTPQEAKYRIEHDTDDERFDGDLHGIAVDLDEALKIACEALEKQIPKKPNDIVCPNCGKLSICDGEYGNGLKYCSECGQRIDWSEEL